MVKDPTAIKSKERVTVRVLVCTGLIWMLSFGTGQGSTVPVWAYCTNVAVTKQPENGPGDDE